MRPGYNELENTMIEIHGDPDSGKTTAVTTYVGNMQRKKNAFVLYIDAGSKVRMPYHPLDPDKTWFLFGLDSIEERALCFCAAKYVDILVIDDITFYHHDLRTLLKSLTSLKNKNKITVILINQRRNVLNHQTGEYEDKPYRYNIVSRYCDYSYDLDTNTWTRLNKEPEPMEYDDFAAMLMHRIS